MATEAELYLRKARESLASAEADVDAGRHNSAANRAYYAAFQAAVAALVTDGVRPTAKRGSLPDWGHQFVMNEFSGKLVWRRKVYPPVFLRTLEEMFDRRIDADYRSFDVGTRQAKTSVRQAKEFLTQVSGRVGRRALREPRAVYEANMKTKTKKKPEEYVEDVKARILEAYPEAKVNTYKRAPRQYTLEVLGDYGEDWDVHDALGDMKAMIHIEHGVWIVVVHGYLTPPAN